MARAFERAREAGIPVITWDSDLLPEDRAPARDLHRHRNRELGVAQAKRAAASWRRGRYDLHPVGRSRGTEPQRTDAGHPRHALGTRPSAASAGRRVEGAGGWTEVEGCPLYTNDDFMLAVQQMDDIFARLRPDRVRRDRRLAAVRRSGLRQVAERHRDRIRPAYRRRRRRHAADAVELLRAGLSHAQVGSGRAKWVTVRWKCCVTWRLAAGSKTRSHTGLDVCTAGVGRHLRGVGGAAMIGGGGDGAIPPDPAEPRDDSGRQRDTAA